MRKKQTVTDDTTSLCISVHFLPTIPKHGATGRTQRYITIVRTLRNESATVQMHWVYIYFVHWARWSSSHQKHAAKCAGMTSMTPRQWHCQRRGLMLQSMRARTYLSGKMQQRHVGKRASACFGCVRLIFGRKVRIASGKMFTAVRNTVGGLKRLAGYAAQEARCAAAAAAAGKHHFSTTTRSRYSGFETPDEEKMVRDAVRSLCSEYPGKLADALLHHRCNLGLLHDILLPPDRSGDRTQQ